MKKALLSVPFLMLWVIVCPGAIAQETAGRTIHLTGVKAEIGVSYGTEEGLPGEDVTRVFCSPDGTVCVMTTAGYAVFREDRWTEMEQAPQFVQDRLSLEEKTVGESGHANTGITQVEPGSHSHAAIAASDGLFTRKGDGTWNRVFPRDGTRSWAPLDVRGVAIDKQGLLWFACPQGVGHEKVGPGNEINWTLYTGEDGLPYADFTTVATGPEGEVYFGTTKGLIRFDGKEWDYRQGPRWLPDDEVRSIAVAPEGTVWIGTSKGVACIQRKPMKLAEKARFFEEEIDKRHRRTPYGFVLGVRLENRGDKSKWQNHDSDNDGLWTGMYGAGECFAYGATRDPFHKKRAKTAFEALRFLSQVTQGGEHPAPRGFPARSILPTDGPDPNVDEYTIEKDENHRANRDPLWKVMHPRWPRSADGKWFWKCDTSSDELDGHYFLYAAYYDLVAESEEEKQRVREVVAAITDHLIEHDYQLVDWDGQPTRWARFGPALMNHDPSWGNERGLNSLSILSYLKVAEYMTGDPKYRQHYDDLIQNHGYAMNLMYPKLHTGPGSGNHSDDEMAFMSFYNLIKYEQNPDLRNLYAGVLSHYWLIERPEMCPLFNYIYAAGCEGAVQIGPWGGADLSASRECLEEAAKTLVDFPLDRIMWSHKNSHRLDIVRLGSHAMFDASGDRGHRRDGFVIPIDERSMEYWNHDPWHLDSRGSGHELADGQAFLLPYYMGLYHKFLTED